MATELLPTPVGPVMTITLPFSDEDAAAALIAHCPRSSSIENLILVTILFLVGGYSLPENDRPPTERKVLDANVFKQISDFNLGGGKGSTNPVSLMHRRPI